jgi:predicted transcriptional regulator
MQRSTKRRLRSQTDREKAWIEIQKHDTFTATTLMDETGISKSNAQSLIQDLRQAGLVERVGTTSPEGKRGEWGVYALTRRPDSWPDAVGTRSPAWRQQVWNTLRFKGGATVPEMRTTFSDDIDVTRDTVYRYLRELERAGVVLRRGRRGTEGQKGSHIIYAIHPACERPKAYSKSELESIRESGEQSDNE